MTPKSRTLHSSLPLNPQSASHSPITETNDGAPTPVFVEDRIGTGPPIVFLHGLLGLKEHFAPAAEIIKDRAECWLVQAPLLSLQGSECSINGVTELVRTYLDENFSTPVVLVGNSLGGHLALRIALEQPQRVRGIVLSGSSGLFERTFEKDVQHRPSREWLDRKITDLFYDSSRMPEGVVDRAFEELSDRKSARSLVRLSRTAKADHMGTRLPLIKQPTMLLWGRQDTVTPASVAEEFASLLPNATIRWIEECGHTPMIERPDEFAAGLNEFLDRLGSTPSDVEAQQEVA